MPHFQGQHDAPDLLTELCVRIADLSARVTALEEAATVTASDAAPDEPADD
jgi:hypothetical protein